MDNSLPTFREQVVAFWEWFPTVADSLAASLRDGTFGDRIEKFQDTVRIGGLAWVFGPGESEGRFSFTISGEGQKAKQLLSHYWLQNSKDVPGWDFYSSRQPSSPELLENIEIQVGETAIDPGSLHIATEVDDEHEVVNIKAWHDAFEQLEEDARFQILFLLLDEAIGEFGTQTRLGEIEFEKTPAAITLLELRSYLDWLWAEKGWHDLTPLEQYTGYGTDEPRNEFDRGDTIAGHTCVPECVLTFLGNGGFLEEDLLEGTGAEFVYVRLDNEIFPETDQVDFRTRIEDALCAELEGDGYVTGGGTGLENSYIDFVLFDGGRSLDALHAGMSRLKLDGKYEVKPFA